MASKAVAQNFLEYAEVMRLKGKVSIACSAIWMRNRKPL
jgi:hypothetical protein